MVPASIHARKKKAKPGCTRVYGGRIFDQHLWQCMGEVGPNTKNSQRKKEVSGTQIMDKSWYY